VGAGAVRNLMTASSACQVYAHPRPSSMPSMARKGNGWTNEDEAGR